MGTTIFLGADHAGFALKEQLKTYLKNSGMRVVDMGAHELNKEDDYPDFGFKVARVVGSGKGEGILICGSAEGMCMVANKVKGVRAAVVDDTKTAALAREHTNANVICLSGWRTAPKSARAIVDAWQSAKFSGTARHVRRINKIKKIEKG